MLKEKIDLIDISLAHHHGTDKVLLVIDDTIFMLDTGWRNEKATVALADRFRTAEGEVSLRVWEHFPKDLLRDPRDSFHKVKQVIDARDDDSVYWDIVKHNQYQHGERISAIVLGILATVVVLGGLVFAWLIKSP